jgi:uncharacterized protein (TIGR00369 family)
MTDPDTADAAMTVEELNAHMGPMGEHMGLEILEASAEQVVARMPVERNLQPYGLLHGGASVALAETAGSILSMMLAGPGRAAVGMTITAVHHRPATTGMVTGTATVVAAGRTTATSSIAITDDAGNRVCTCTLVCQLRDAPPARG